MSRSLTKGSVFVAALVAGLLMLALSATSAHAVATSNSTAIIDWSSVQFTWTRDGGFLAYTWAPGDPFPNAWSSIAKESFSEGVAENDTASDWHEEEVLDWGATSASASVTNATGDAWTGDNPSTVGVVENEVGEKVWARADGIVTMWSLSDGFADRWLDFNTSLGGLLEIEVDYSLTQDLTTENPWDYADGFSIAALVLCASEGGGLACDSNYDFLGVAFSIDILDLVNDTGVEPEITPNAVSGGADLSLTSSGTLTVSLHLDPSDHGVVGFIVANEADAAVPEPATLLLLGSGLLGLAGWRRKRAA